MRRLVIDKNPGETTTNSDLKLTGGLIHLDAITQTSNVRERTILSKGTNLNTTLCKRKGSTAYDLSPAYLLRLFGMYQYFHRYVLWFNYITGFSNHVTDAISRDIQLTLPDLFS